VEAETTEVVATGATGEIAAATVKKDSNLLLRDSIYFITL
jgi:hypothetical protein